MNKFEKITTLELWSALQYVEGVAHGANQMVASINQNVKENLVTASEVEPLLNKLVQGFVENDNLSFEIEREMARRFKNKLSVRFTSTTLTACNDEFSKMLEKRKKTNPSMKVE